jgi:hypothetical protein
MTTGEIVRVVATTKDLSRSGITRVPRNSIGRIVEVCYRGHGRATLYRVRFTNRVSYLMKKTQIKRLKFGS